MNIIIYFLVFIYSLNIGDCVFIISNKSIKDLKKGYINWVWCCLKRF